MKAEEFIDEIGDILVNIRNSCIILAAIISIITNIVIFMLFN